jgi:hypothetical protein
MMANFPPRGQREFHRAENQDRGVFRIKQDWSAQRGSYPRSLSMSVILRPMFQPPDDEVLHQPAGSLAETNGRGHRG